MIQNTFKITCFLLFALFNLSINFPFDIKSNPAMSWEIPISDGFDYPVGGYYYCCTPQKDGDGWYNANSFGYKDHMGEDWNREEGGNVDCNYGTYAVSNGRIIYSNNAGPTWGNIIIIRHRLPDGREVESLYAHIQDDQMLPFGTLVKRRDKIGMIGDGADPCGDHSPYSAHLHFEIREPSYRFWGRVGPGYSNDDNGMIPPTRFIEQNRWL